MLRDEYRVAAIRRLLAVLVRVGGREPLSNELVRVPAYGVGSAELSDRSVAAGEMESRTERLLGQPIQPSIDLLRPHEADATGVASRSGDDDEADLLELLDVGVAGLRNGPPRSTKEVQIALGRRRRSAQDLLQ